MQLRYLVALTCLTACTANVEEHTSSQSSPLQGGSTAICHSTGSSTNPFVLITVSSSALAAHQHHHHGHDIIPAPPEGCSGDAPPPPFCTPGSTITCYEGPTGTEGVGTCTSGTQTCAEDGGSFGPCTGSVEPIAEVCGDALDNDCDGLTDERCIGDFVWNDLNVNGIQDSGEPGLAGATLHLRVGTAVIATTVSDANGIYFFSDVVAGTYNIVGDPLVPDFITTALDAGNDDALDNDFGGQEHVCPDFVFPDNGSIDHIDHGMTLFVPD